MHRWFVSRTCSHVSPPAWRRSMPGRVASSSSPSAPEWPRSIRRLRSLWRSCSPRRTVGCTSTRGGGRTARRTEAGPPGPSSRLRELPEHEGQDPAVPVVVELVGSVDPASHGELLGALLTGGLHGQPLPGREAICHPGDLVRLLASETEG